MAILVRINIIACLIMLFAACDPCRQFAEQVCACKISEEERKECIMQLNLAKQHKNFDKAKNENTCLRAMEHCSCKKINTNDDKECGFDRE